MSRHVLVIHTMFDDVFDFMPPFLGLFSLIQRFLIERLDQFVDCTLHRFDHARFRPVWCGGCHRRRYHSQSSTIPKRSNSCASFIFITLMTVVS